MARGNETNKYEEPVVTQYSPPVLSQSTDVVSQSLSMSWLLEGPAVSCSKAEAKGAS